MLEQILIVLLALMTLASLAFVWESHREKERRALRKGLEIAAATVLFSVVVIFIPALHLPVIVILLGCFLLCLIPARKNKRALKGARGWVVGQAGQVDEREIVFARNRSMTRDEVKYREFYGRHPEWEEIDARRREAGGPLGNPPGKIDGSYRPNVSMIVSTFVMPAVLGPHGDAVPDADHPPADMDPARASLIVKGWAKNLGADLAGICRTDRLWTYSRRGEIHYDNWDEWGQELGEALPYAVVIATEMKYENMGSGPHTPCVVESGAKYALGSYITTILAKWFSLMGYRATAEHHRRYTTLMVPLAVDAGLGEMGRNGYLVAPKFGARIRLFACLTDMPLVPDQPISIGVDEFCRRCKKCAEVCPSRSIPLGEKTVKNGVEKWVLNAETCFDFWGKIGTDCSLCMTICPFSRPNNYLHNGVRWFAANTWAGQNIFPHIDNWLYGKKWRPKPAPDWLQYPKGPEVKREVYGIDESGSLG
jgi:reductive dehalogenase